MHVYYIVCSAYPFTNTVVLPCAQCRFLYCVVLSSDTFIMLGWGHAIQSVQFLMLVVQVALFQRSQRYSIQICKFVYLWVRRLLAYSHLSAVSSPTASLLWEVSTCVFYLLCFGVGLRSLSHGGI